jgi:hypothetical protein
MMYRGDRGKGGIGDLRMEKMERQRRKRGSEKKNHSMSGEKRGKAGQLKNKLEERPLAVNSGGVWSRECNGMV